MTLELTEREKALIDSTASKVVESIGAQKSHDVQPHAPSITDLFDRAKPGDSITVGDTTITLSPDAGETEKPAEAQKVEAASRETEGKPEGDSVEMNAKLLSAVENPLRGTKVPFINTLDLGPLVVGGGSGLLFAEVVDGWKPPTESDGAGGTQVNWANAAIKGAGIAVIGTVGNNFMSKEAQKLAATVIGANLAIQVLPVNKLVNKIVGWIDGNGGSAGQSQALAAQRQAAQHSPAPRGDFYFPVSQMASPNQNSKTLDSVFDR